MVFELERDTPLSHRAQACQLSASKPGTPCFAMVFGVSINLCFSMASSLLRTHPRRQRCGSAALHHTSLRSLTATASLIVGVSRSVFLRSRTSVAGGDRRECPGICVVSVLNTSLTDIYSLPILNSHPGTNLISIRNLSWKKRISICDDRYFGFVCA